MQKTYLKKGATYYSEYVKNSYNLIRQTIQLKNEEKVLNRHLKVMNKYMKRYLKLLVTKGMKVKTTVRYHCIHTRMSKIKKTDYQVLLRKWRNWNTYAFLVIIQNGRATLETSFIIIFKVNIKLSIWSIDTTPKRNNRCPPRPIWKCLEQINS